MPRNESACKVCNKHNTLIIGPESGIICTNCGAEFSGEEWAKCEYGTRDRIAFGNHRKELGSIIGTTKTDGSLDTSVHPTMKVLCKYDRIIKSNCLKEKSLGST